MRATLALELVDLAERALLGRRPVYDPRRFWRRPWLGQLARFLYGSTLEKVYHRLRIPPLIFGPAVATAELFLLPLARATPPIRKWRHAEIALLFAHATAFALLAAA